MLAAFLLLTLIATILDKGECINLIPHFVAIQITYSVLEYLSREDADRAIKELDGKELRGRPVRVTLDDSVRDV